MGRAACRRRLGGEQVEIGEAVVEFHGHVGRCAVTSQNPATGLRTWIRWAALRRIAIR